MRIGINARRLQGQRLGVGRYIEYLLKYWQRMILPSEEVVLYLREELPERDRVVSRAFRANVLRPALTGLVWESTLLPRGARRADVLFGPSYTLPLVYHGKTVVAIHSVNEIQTGTHPWWYRFTYGSLYRRSALEADRVIVPSQSTLEDIQALYGIPAERLVVVPQGVDDSFAPVSDPERLRVERVRWLGDDTPFVLFVGKLSQRRNIPTLIRAFAELKLTDGLPHKLLLFGPNHLGLPLRELASELGIGDSVVQTDGRVDNHSELAAIYSAADLYVNPSAYEGFSITLVEALACGTPTVAVDRAALREIADDAALLVDEPSPEPIAEAMHRALTDDVLRHRLRTRGVERATSFRWEQTARLTLDVLRDAAHGAGP